jgi:hypothetical protein
MEVYHVIDFGALSGGSPSRIYIQEMDHKGSQSGLKGARESARVPESFPKTGKGSNKDGQRKPNGIAAGPNGAYDNPKFAQSKPIPSRAPD